MLGRIIAFSVVALPLTAAGQGIAERVDEAAAVVERMPLRTEFVSFDMREYAERDDRAKNQFYVETDLRSGRATFDVPVLWLDREFFLHVEGVASGEVAVNGRTVGAIGMSPQEVNITRAITDGTNTIEIAGMKGTPRAFVYSQPRIRIEDFIVEADADSLYKYGVLRLGVVVSNGYNFPETINLGYDIYAPKDKNGKEKLLHFDNRDVTVRGLGRDTVRFETEVYGMPANFWSAEKPQLHKVMLIVAHNRRHTEYIPFKVGFGRTEVAGGRLMRNGKAVTVKAVSYDAGDVKTATADLAKFKKAGKNTIVVARPQPYWFYELTDRTGFYVFDTPEKGADANDPELLGGYLMRAKAVFARSRNHVSVAGWSLGAPHGNGYNLYRTYRWLKANEPRRPVVYDDARGEWNSDMEPIGVDGR